MNKALAQVEDDCREKSDLKEEACKTCLHRVSVLLLKLFQKIDSRKIKPLNDDKGEIFVESF